MQRVIRCIETAHRRRWIPPGGFRHRSALTERIQSSMQNLIKRSHVALDERSYPIHIGSGLLSGRVDPPHQAEEGWWWLPMKQSPLYLERLSATLSLLA